MLLSPSIKIWYFLGLDLSLIVPLLHFGCFILTLNLGFAHTELLYPLVALAILCQSLANSITSLTFSLFLTHLIFGM